MRYIRLAFLAVLAIVLVSLALANRTIVTLNVLPETLAEAPYFSLLAVSVTLPLYLVIFGGILAGVALGYVLEWFREQKHRSESSRKAGEVKQLKRELKRTQAERDKDKDEVLAILDQAS